MSQLVLVIFAFLYFSVEGQQYEGDLCLETHTSTSGSCKILSKCPSAVANIRKGIYPTSCGFAGRDIIVCCVEPVSTTTAATTTTTSTTTTSIPITSPTKPQKQVLGSRIPGEISDEKCRDYSQFVWTREVSPILLVGAGDIVKRECPFDRLELVVGGSPASLKEFPHMVQLGYGENPVQWACGGSLISEQFVLTAGHCIEDRILGYALQARMGYVDIDDPQHVQEFNIVQRTAHPQYSEPSHYHDIGIVKLHKKAQLNIWVRPACLYTNRQSPWSKVIATGWGKTEFGGTESNVLLRVILELFSQPKCNPVYKQQTGTLRLKEGIKDDLMICAGHSTELKDTCQGDSGGPLQVYRNGGPNMTCMYDIIGVTSFGKACGLAVNIPGVYTRVSNYIQWIEDIVWPPS